MGQAADDLDMQWAATGVETVGVSAPRPSFQIDTGTDTLGPRFGFGRDVLMDGVLDSLPPNAPQHDIDRALFAAIRRDLHAPVLAKTVRAHFLMHMHLIAPLAERNPAIFDQLIEELHSALSDRA